MIGRLKDLTMNIDRSYNVTVTVRDDFRAEYDRLHDTDIDVTIKKYRKRRSLDANAYSWVLMDKIANAMNIPKTEVYREAIRDIGGVSETVCVKEIAAQRLRDAWSAHGIGWQTDTMPSKIEGCVNVILYYGSSTYDSKQMSALIDHIAQDAKALGIETATPMEMEQMRREWARHEQKYHANGKNMLSDGRDDQSA